MNRKMIAYTLGRVLLVEGALMLLSVIVGLIYNESETIIFIPSIMISLAAGLLVFSKKAGEHHNLRKRGLFYSRRCMDTHVVIGCLPFILCGENISFSTGFLRPYPALQQPAQRRFRKLNLFRNAFFSGAALPTG